MRLLPQLSQLVAELLAFGCQRSDHRLALGQGGLHFCQPGGEPPVEISGGVQFALHRRRGLGLGFAGRAQRREDQTEDQAREAATGDQNALPTRFMMLFLL